MSIFTPTEGCPTAISEILIGPWLFAFFGVMLGIGVVKQFSTTGVLPKTWLLTFGPTLVGLFLGFQRFMYLFDTGYQSTLASRKLIVSHYLAFIGPILCVALVLILIRRTKMTEKNRVY